MLKRTILLAATTTLATASPIHGQVAQTPENAHTFILQVLNSDDVLYASPGNQWILVQSQYAKSGWVKVSGMPPFKIGLARSSACTTVFLDQMGSQNKADLDATGKRADIRWVRKYKERVAKPLDWTKVKDIAVDGMIVGFTEAGEQHELTFGTNAMATRVAYAMQVISDSCDPTAGLGF